MMTTSTGLDNRASIPPFLPSGRGEDTLFGVTLQKCYGNLYIGFLPYAVLHAPPECRRYAPLQMNFRVCDVLMLAMDTFVPPQTDSRQQKLRALGRHLQGFYEMKPLDFRNWLRTSGQSAVTSCIALCEDYLNLFSRTPHAWVVLMNSWLSTMSKMLSDPDLIVNSAEFRIMGDVDRRYETLQSFVGSFGKALIEWPDIVDATLSLAASGHRLAQPVIPAAATCSRQKPAL